MALDLTLKQEAFCQAYMRTGDKSAAYREAYSCENMKASTVNRKAFLVFSIEKVNRRISELKKIVAKVADEKFEITTTSVLQHLNILLRARIDEYLDFHPKKGITIKPFEELTEQQLMAVESIRQNRFGEIELKLHGKQWVFEMINKHIGFYEKENRQNQPLLQITGMRIVTEEDRNAKIEELKAKLLGYEPQSA